MSSNQLFALNRNRLIDYYRYYDERYLNESVTSAMKSTSDEAMQSEYDKAHRTLRDESDFISTCSQYYNKEELSDIVLAVGDDKYFAHKFMLAKGSDVFKLMLFDRRFEASDQTQEGREFSVLELSESAECQLVFPSFLRFLYTAEIDIDCDQAVGILCLADKYNVAALKRLICDYMVEMTKSPQVANALAWYPWGKALNLVPLLDECKRTIAWSYQDIIQSEEFLRMDKEFLIDMLSSSELVVQNEYTLYEAVHAWLTDPAHIDNLEEYAHSLLPVIRFPQMLVGQVFQIEMSELATNMACKDLIKDLLSKAYRFRAICQSQPTLASHFSDDCFYMPREYTSLIVDVVRMQNTLRFGIQVDVKMYTGPAPSEDRNGDWKITYRKNNELWSIQMFPHESALVNAEARMQASVIIYNEGDKVINVYREPLTIVQRGMPITFNVELPEEDMCKNMAVLLKPLP